MLISAGSMYIFKKKQQEFHSLPLVRRYVYVTFRYVPSNCAKTDFPQKIFKVSFFLLTEAEIWTIIIFALNGKKSIYMLCGRSSAG